LSRRIKSAYLVCTAPLMILVRSRHTTRGEWLPVVWWLRTKIKRLLIHSFHSLPCTPPVAIAMACAAGTSVRNLWVDTSSRSQRRRHSCTALELSSSALVPPRCSLSLYYPRNDSRIHLLPLELRSRAGAYSSNHRFLTLTSARTYYSPIGLVHLVK
jgi:hypothetical protein